MVRAEQQHRAQVLESLCLWSNNCGPDGARLLAQMLVVNVGLESLDLRNNSIAQGAQSLARGLQENRTLKSLNLMWNGVTATVAAQFLEAGG